MSVTVNAASRPTTFLEALIASLRRTIRVPEGTIPPVAVLWTDDAGAWRPIISKLRAELPELFTLGQHDPASRTGPAVWLKCVVDGVLAESPPEDVVPVLYLPGVSRQELRAGGSCRLAYQPLVELLFRGRAWHQENGKDWTLEAFVVSEEGLGLDLARDSLTQAALLRSLPALATTPLDSLRGRRLYAHDFDHLSVPDLVRDVLRWLSDAAGFRNELDAARWETFCHVTRTTFRVDPEHDDPDTAASLLVEGNGQWNKVWQRFTEAPRAYRSISGLLRRSHSSTGKLLFDPSRLPAVNDGLEDELRRELERAARLPHEDACTRVLDLEREHGPRRGWPWAELGESSLAEALLPLARLASLARRPVGGASLESAVTAYVEEGWQCDRAAMDALSLPLPPGHGALIASVVRSMYEPWLATLARSFQAHVSGEYPGAGRQIETEPTKETCVLFVDGMRFDVAAMLQEKLEARDLRVTVQTRLAPVPTVTATGKPVACPVANLVTGLAESHDFAPVMVNGKQPASASRLRDEMARLGVDVMEGDNVRVPSSSRAIGWSECGRFDDLGHKLGLGLAQHLDQELESVVEHIHTLLSAGWARVRIVTDHGWLLLPGGLPKVELAASLTATKWGRCASVNGNAHPPMPTYRWHWHPDVRIVSPPGISSFFAGAEYAHGGVSPQECVLADLTVERGTVEVRTSVTEVQWRGMRLRVRVAPAGDGIRVDLRRNAKDPSTTLVAAAKEVDESGHTSLVVVDDNDDGAGAVIVVLDRAGTVLDRRPTTVGEPS
jgi:hypothetical protein